MTNRINEPNDNHSYGPLWIPARTVALIRKAFAHYQTLLEADIAALKADPELVAVVDDISSLPVSQEAAHAARIGAWLDAKITERNTPHESHLLSLDHGYVRRTKSVCLLYIGYLKRRRDNLAQRPETSTHLISSIDGAIASLEESISSGVFKAASICPLLAVEATVPQAAAPLPAPIAISGNAVARPVLLSTIEILDTELRARCVDLFESFLEDGQHDRLDTVVTEATRILENRLRRVTSAPETTVGVELATYALSGASPRIRVSLIAAEQEAAHLMFRGLFGFIRNHVHHRLTGHLVPQRVLQILGMIDYLLLLSEGTDVGVGKEPM